jgi:hypothetical protein
VYEDDARQRLTTMEKERRAKKRRKEKERKEVKKEGESKR